MFNKPLPIDIAQNIDWPSFCYFDIDEELGYQGSFQEAYKKASQADRDKIKAVPNFDAGVFFEITGIRVHEPDNDRRQ